jgi:hypothetical protein
MSLIRGLALVIRGLVVLARGLVVLARGLVGWWLPARAARRYARNNPQRARFYLDRARRFVDEGTKGKYRHQIEKATRKLADLGDFAEPAQAPAETPTKRVDEPARTTVPEPADGATAPTPMTQAATASARTRRAKPQGS